jgi:hypothetical protein
MQNLVRDHGGPFIVWPSHEEGSRHSNYMNIGVMRCDPTRFYVTIPYVAWHKNDDIGSPTVAFMTCT